MGMDAWIETWLSKIPTKGLIDHPYQPQGGTYGIHSAKSALTATARPLHDPSWPGRWAKTCPSIFLPWLSTGSCDYGTHLEDSGMSSVEGAKARVCLGEKLGICSVVNGRHPYPSIEKWGWGGGVNWVHQPHPRVTDRASPCQAAQACQKEERLQQVASPSRATPCLQPFMLDLPGSTVVGGGGGGLGVTLKRQVSGQTCVAKAWPGTKDFSDLAFRT